MNFDITVRDGEVIIGQEAVAMLAEARELDLIQKRIAVQMDALKEALKQAMEENGIKSYENDDVKIVYKDSFVRSSVDTKRLKEDGLYDLYAKSSVVKPSVMVSFKE